MEISKKLPDFDSIEKVKEFISDTNNNVGVIRIVMKNNEKENVAMNMNDFIEKVGIDNAAKFIFENSKKASTITIGENEIDNLFKKFIEDPKSLTEEEKILLSMIIDKKEDKFYVASHGVLELIIKSFMEVGKDVSKVLELKAFLSILLTLIEGVYVLNSEKLSAYCDGPTYNEMVKSTIEQINIPENIDDEALFIALTNIIGNRFVVDKNSKNKKIDFYKVSEVLGLDTEFIFEEE